jgi:hypothetical protein
MEIDTMVSVWAGRATSLVVAEKLLRYQYTEDGDVSESWFTTTFMIEYYDEDFSELLFSSSNNNSIADLLQGVSYAENDYINRVLDSIQQKNFERINLIYMLFNFSYQASVQTAQAEEIDLTFIGVFQYR